MRIAESWQLINIHAPSCQPRGIAQAACQNSTSHGQGLEIHGVLRESI